MSGTLMRPHLPVRCRRVLAIGAFAALLAAPTVRAQSIDVALTPIVSSVAPGDTFALDLQCMVAGGAFNGFVATLDYDPAALTFLPASPLSLQEGALMTGACGNTFHQFTAAADSMTATDILLCSHLSLTGPGQLYRVRFVASGPPQVTHVRIRHIQFYDAGLYAAPATTTDATIGLGVTLGAPAPATGPLRLDVLPNPARGAVRFELGTRDVSEVSVYDVGGRRVRRLSGTDSVVWDGRDDSGRAAPAGVYLAVARRGGTFASRSFILLR